MKFTVLVDDNLKGLPSEHGFSLYVETDKSNFLVDFGASDLWLKNARALGLDIKVDFAVCSHNHNDHNGGLSTFKTLFPNKPVYIGMGTNMTYGGRFFPHYKMGIEKSFFKKYSKSLFCVDNNLCLDGNIFIVNVRYDKEQSFGSYQYVQKCGLLIKDRYKHEICVCVVEEQTLYIISPCSHKGVVNIIQNCMTRFDAKEVVFIGGIHTKGRESAPLNCSESKVLDIATKLKQFPIKAMYLGHCTGDRAISILKECGLNVFELGNN